MVLSKKTVLRVFLVMIKELKTQWVQSDQQVYLHTEMYTRCTCTLRCTLGVLHLGLYTFSSLSRQSNLWSCRDFS